MAAAPRAAMAAVAALWMAKISGCATRVGGRSSSSFSLNSASLSDHPAIWSEMRIDLVELGAEFRVMPVGGDAHSGPLAAIARIDKGDRQVVPDRGAAGELRAPRSRT